MNTKKFFTYDPTGEGFEEHSSEDEARASCQSILDEVLSDDYSEDDVAFICWGEIKGHVMLKNKREPTEEERKVYGWDFVADVALEDV